MAAAITGSFVALALAFRYLQRIGAVTKPPLTGQVSAVSCGIAKGIAVLDLDYEEDSTAEADANFVFTDDGGIVEIQGTAEHKPFAEREFLAMLALARKGCSELASAQRQVLGFP
jgi:ribonuclease PH